MSSVRGDNEDEPMNQRLHDAVTSDLWRFLQPFLLALMTVLMGFGVKAGWGIYDMVADVRNAQIQGAVDRKYLAKVQDALLSAQKDQSATNASMRHDIDRNTYAIGVVTDWMKRETKETRPSK